MFARHLFPFRSSACFWTRLNEFLALGSSQLFVAQIKTVLCSPLERVANVQSPADLFANSTERKYLFGSPNFNSEKR